MALAREVLPPPHPDCEYCMAGYIRINEELVFHDEKFVKCEPYYNTRGWVHIFKPTVAKMLEQYDREKEMRREEGSR